MVNKLSNNFISSEMVHKLKNMTFFTSCFWKMKKNSVKTQPYLVAVMENSSDFVSFIKKQDEDIL